MDYIKVTFVGRVGKDAEMRYAPDGKAITSYSVAVNNFKGSGENATKTTMWIKVTSWAAQAERDSQYVKKGMEILIEGRLTFDPVTGGPNIWAGTDGFAHANFEVSANEVRYGAAPAGAAGAKAGVPMAKSAQEELGQPAPVSESEIPF